MKTNKFFRIITILCLCIAMILPVLSCAETSGGDTTTASPDQSEAAQTQAPTDTEPDEKGCGGFVGSAGAITAIAAGTILSKKKKKK